MSMDEASTAAVPPLLLLGDASAEVCADGFCAVPPAQPQETYAAETGPPRTGAAAR